MHREDLCPAGTGCMFPSLERPYQNRCCGVGMSRVPTIRPRGREAISDPSGIVVHAKLQHAAQPGSAGVRRFGLTDVVRDLDG